MSKLSYKRDLTALSRNGIRAKFGRNPNGPETRDRDLWHRQSLVAAGGITELTFFNVQVGGNNPAGGVLTLQDTNMEESGRMPENKDFLIEAIKVVPTPQAATEANRLLDLQKLADVGIVVLETNDLGSQIEIGTLREVFTDLRLIGIDTTEGNAPGGVYELRNPIHWIGGTNLRPKIKFPSAGGSPVLTAAVELTFFLKGQQITGSLSTTAAAK